MSTVTASVLVQENQPAGVPPLPLTGERTLPDVPAENYWYRRHLAVYEWIAGQTGGTRMLDLGCGEGYGAATLALGDAVSVVGVDANPEAYEHARLRYTEPGLRFERGLVETWGAPGTFDVITFLQTVEHVQDPVAVLSHVSELLAPAGVAYISTPNLLRIAPLGAKKSDNPWHLREYKADEFRELCDSVFPSVRMYGIYHAGWLRIHENALRAGWDRIHRRLRISRVFYDRFVPAIRTQDFELSEVNPLYRALDFLAVCSLAPFDARFGPD